LANVTPIPEQVLPIGSRSVEMRIGKLEFELGVPTKDTVNNLYDQMDFRRACQAYILSFRDKEGHAFDGAKTYRLHVQPNPPAKQFWSVTLYDVDTRSLTHNKEQRSERSSRQDPVKNVDGSVYLYFAPTAPNGFERNWIPTLPGKAWFAAFRFYGPLEAYFDKSWPLPDIEWVR